MDRGIGAHFSNQDPALPTDHRPPSWGSALATTRGGTFPICRVPGRGLRLSQSAPGTFARTCPHGHRLRGAQTQSWGEAMESGQPS